MLADDHMVRAGDAQVTTRAVDMARCMAIDKDSRGSCILLNSISNHNGSHWTPGEIAVVSY